MKPDRNQPVVIPDELQEIFTDDKKPEACFKRFTQGQQRKFTSYISEAKTSETRKWSVQKVIPLTIDNIGFKYE